MHTEEDFLKCLGPTYLGDFALKGKELRLKGQNRIGNLIVENQNYCEFEDWLKVSLWNLKCCFPESIALLCSPVFPGTSLNHAVLRPASCDTVQGPSGYVQKSLTESARWKVMTAVPSYLHPLLLAVVERF